MKLNVYGRLNAFGDPYARSEDGVVYRGHERPEHRGLTECQICLEELEWIAVPVSRVPRTLANRTVQAVIET
jgi:hypothetical protein